MSETETGAASGAAQGAAAGAAFGPWGIVIGAVVGGVIGLVAGKNKKLARRYAAKAADMKRKQQTMQLAVQRRDIIRQQRIQRAQAVAAGASEDGVQSSAVQGAASSLTSQSKAATNYFDSMVSLDNAYQMYAKKSGKAQGKSDELFTLLGSGSNLAAAGGDIYGLATTPKAPSSGSYTSFNSSAAVSNMANNSAYSTFGQSLNLSN